MPHPSEGSAQSSTDRVDLAVTTATNAVAINLRENRSVRNCKTLKSVRRTEEQYSHSYCESKLGAVRKARQFGDPSPRDGILLRSPLGKMALAGFALAPSRKLPQPRLTTRRRLHGRLSPSASSRTVRSDALNVRLSACTLGSYHATPVCSSLCPSLPFCCPIVVLSGAMHVEKVPASIIFLLRSLRSVLFQWSLLVAHSVLSSAGWSDWLFAARLAAVSEGSCSFPSHSGGLLRLGAPNGCSFPPVSVRHWLELAVAARCLGLAGATGWDHWLALTGFACSRAIYSCPSLPFV